MVKTASSIYPVNCFSMNPSIAVNCLKGTGKSFVQNALDIRGVIGEETPFFLEAMGDTAEELVEDAKAMVKAVPGNTLAEDSGMPGGFQGNSRAQECRHCHLLHRRLHLQPGDARGHGGRLTTLPSTRGRLDKNGGDGIEVVRRHPQAGLRLLPTTSTAWSARPPSRLRSRSKRPLRPVPITSPSTLRCLRPWRSTP